MRRVAILLVVTCFFLLCSGSPAIAQGQIDAVTFNQMPAFEEDGNWPSLGEYAQDVGFDTARSWQAGEYPADVITLGDISEGLQPGKFTLADLTDLDVIRIADIPLLSELSLAELIETIPFLKDWPIEEIAGLSNALAAWTADEQAFSSLGDALSQHSEIGSLPTGQVIGEQAVSSIPNVESVTIEEFPRYESQSVASIPGLSDIPLSSFPAQTSHLSYSPIPFAKQDIAFGEEEYSGEKSTIKPVSGSIKEGFAVPCNGGCAHIELTGPTWEGMQWMTKAHKVPDGEGFLGSLPGFDESGAYRLPFGESFALKVGKTDEKTGEADWWLGFRVCKRGFINLGCTAYFLEVPLGITTREKDPVITGVRDGKGGSSQALKAPPDWESKRPATPPELRAIIREHSRPSYGGGLCGEGPGGISYEALAKAYKTIESNVNEYDSIGEYVYGGKGGRGQELWGRGLGKYQYMTYREEVRALIRPKPGGAEFLAKGDRGDKPSVAEMRRLFPPEEQDRLFKVDQEQLIKKAMAEGYEGDALLARVGELHTGGRGARPGSHEGYGRRLVSAYKEKLEDSDCGKATGNFINPNPRGTLTSGFGYRTSPGGIGSKNHGGIDLSSGVNSPILATDGGTVIFAGWGGGFGNLVEIDHGGGTISKYAHLSKILVRAGDAVTQGDVIGEEGTTGVSTGVHLHFELHIQGQKVDPAHYVPL